MAEKPTYEELEQKVKELEQEAVKRKRTEEALRRDKHIISVTADHMSFLNRDYVYQAVNEAYLLSHQKERQEIIGHSVADLLGANIFEQHVKENLNRCLTGEKIHYQEWFDFPGLGQCYMDVAYYPYFEADGTISGVVVSSHDITEQKQAEEARRVSEEKLNLIIDTSPIGICTVDLLGNFVTTNIAYEQMLGYSKEELLELSFFDVTHPDYRPKNKDLFQNMFSLETAGFSMEKKYIRKGGTIIDVAVHATGVVGTEGTVRFGTAFVEDITERRLAEKALRKSEERLQQSQKMESIGTLAGGIAHDFNNILFPIVGHTEMLLEDVPEGSPLRNSINQVYSSALRARDLVKQILTFSRQDSHEIKLIKIQPIIKEALQLIRSTIPTSIEIKQYIKKDCGAIKADPTQIHQIVMNLATNAYHAMEDTGGELKIGLKEIELGEQDVINLEMEPGTHACLTVADTGVGMDKDLTERIFDPFFTTKEEGKGTGMGLSVVHGIVHNAGGSIHVYSEPGKGTEFHVYLPLKMRSSKQQETQTEKPIQRGTERILLVDDEVSIIFMEKQMLERLGYQVVPRTSSVEALEAFKTNPEKFDLVITDMAMPNMNGNQLASELIKIRPDIPILLCTGFSEKMPEEKAKALGIKGFLMKPIVRKDLSNTIREVLDKGQGK